MKTNLSLVLALLQPRYWVKGASVATLLMLAADPLLAQENHPSEHEDGTHPSLASDRSPDPTDSAEIAADSPEEESTIAPDSIAPDLTEGVTHTAPEDGTEGTPEADPEEATEEVTEADPEAAASAEEIPPQNTAQNTAPNPEPPSHKPRLPSKFFPPLLRKRSPNRRPPLSFKPPWTV
jgi:hypothetical protein